MLQEMEKNGWGSLVVAIRRIIEGERNADALLHGLARGRYANRSFPLSPLSSD
jgi:hypothetical protein